MLANPYAGRLACGGRLAARFASISLWFKKGSEQKRTAGGILECLGWELVQKVSNDDEQSMLYRCDLKVISLTL
jgi:hypothetical protein